jgi:hypothetical protein
MPTNSPNALQPQVQRATQSRLFKQQPAAVLSSGPDPNKFGYLRCPRDELASATALLMCCDLVPACG